MLQPEPEPARWWEQRPNDPTLTSLVQRAAGQNLDLAAAEARCEARASRDAAAGLSPQVDASGIASRSRSKQGGTGNLFRAGFDAAWGKSTSSAASGEALKSPMPRPGPPSRMSAMSE